MAQLKSIQNDQAKGKTSVRSQGATEELHYLMNFNQSIGFAIAKTVQHLSDFVFVSMAKITLAKKDSYLDHLKSGIKQDTFSSLRNAPLHLATLFPGSVLKRG